MKDAYADLGHAYTEWRINKELLEHEIRENNMRRTKENITHWEPTPRIVKTLLRLDSQKFSSLNVAYDRVRQLEQLAKRAS